MLKRLLLSLLALLCAVLLSARESTFSQMKKTLDESSLPLVNLMVDLSRISRDSFVSGEIEIADYHRRTESSSDTVKYRCKLRIRGGTASYYAKKSFAVKLTGDKGEDMKANILGLRNENSWILDAMAIDRIRMRNRVCFDIWNKMSHTPYPTRYANRNGTSGQFVEVFINGEYHGLYCMTDKIDRELLGLEKAKHSDGGEVLISGLLYKGINWDSGHNLLSYATADVDKATWNAWELQYPEDYPSLATWQPLMDLIDFCSQKTPHATFQRAYHDYFYPANLLDYMTFTLALNVGDNAYKNTFLSVVDINAGHRYLLTPWDMDMSLGGNWDGQYNDALADIRRYNGIAPFNRLMVLNMDGFADSLKTRWHECHETLFCPDSVNRLLDSYADAFTSSGAWEREHAKWNGNPVPLAEDIAAELDYVKTWYERNYNHLCEQLGGRSGMDMATAPSHHHAAVFTIGGMKVDTDKMPNPPKGLYIVNGKKKVVR